MNQNLILAILELKGVLSRPEVEKIADYVASSPQSTYVVDTINAISPLLDTTPVALQSHLQDLDESLTKKLVPVLKSPGPAKNAKAKPAAKDTAGDNPAPIDSPTVDSPEPPKNPDQQVNPTDVKNITDQSEKK